MEDIFIEGIYMYMHVLQFIVAGCMWMRICYHTIKSCAVHAGVEVQYATSVPGFSDGTSDTALIRCLLLLWTGDYPAQCEIGKTIFNGMHPCRRCKMNGMTVLSHGVF